MSPENDNRIPFSHFRADKFGFTIILSSPAHFTGEFQSKRFLFTHAWPTFGSREFEFDPRSRHTRHFFALSFRERERTPEEDNKRQPPYYPFVGDFFAVFLCLLFGKRFDNHGFLLDHGFYCLPNVQPVQPRTSIDALPFTSEPRRDLGIPLTFAHAEVLIPLLDKIFDEVEGSATLSDDLNAVYVAGRFYVQALRQYDSDPELAYLSLVNAGEVLTSELVFSNGELHDADLAAVLSEIESALKPETASRIKRQLFNQISRKFRKGLAKLLNSRFYEGSESALAALRLKEETIEKHLKAAYELRSKHLHEGVRFANWVFNNHQGSEIMIGTPAYGSSEWKKLISAIPVLAGLERIIRFALLRHIHQRLTPINTLLD